MGNLHIPSVPTAESARISVLLQSADPQTPMPLFKNSQYHTSMAGLKSVIIHHLIVSCLILLYSHVLSILPLFTKNVQKNLWFLSIFYILSSIQTSVPLSVSPFFPHAVIQKSNSKAISITIMIFFIINKSPTFCYCSHLIINRLWKIIQQKNHCFYSLSLSKQ